MPIRNLALLLSTCLTLFVLSVAICQEPDVSEAELRRVAATTNLVYDAAAVDQWVANALQAGDIQRGAVVFADVKLACSSCHRIGDSGGTVGPDLTKLAKQRPEKHIVESVLWPDREVEPQFASWRMLTTDGEVFTGFKVQSTETELQLRDLASGHIVSIATEDIEHQALAGSVMPAELTASLSKQQQLDLFRFLFELGRDEGASTEAISEMLAHAQSHAPAEFEFSNAPLDPLRWPHHDHFVNRQRTYDFYTKQAEYFRRQHHRPLLLPAARGLDGGEQGHWGNQNETTWESDAWNASQLGSLQAGVFHAEGTTIPRGVCVRLGDQQQLSACFNPDTLQYEAVWGGGFVSFAPFRHGFMNGLLQQGTPLPRPEPTPIKQSFHYHGFYRHGPRVVFAYRIADVEYLDSAWAVDGQFVREVAPLDEHSLRHVLRGGPAQWPQVLSTHIKPGPVGPLAIDTIELPVENPWQTLLFCGGVDFLPDGSALVCTMQGDVWRVSGLDGDAEQPGTAHWKRFAAGLHHALGLVVSDGRVYVQCRDQLTRLTDVNDDGEADFYECFSNAFDTSAAGHDFICGLERDPAGNFYTASGNQGLLRIAADGDSSEVLATGFRNPDGLAVLGNDAVTVPCSEGEWTPASMICRVDLRAAAQVISAGSDSQPRTPHFGYGGLRDGRPPELPLCYLPRLMDNSSGGQASVPQDQWGPLAGQLLHFSFGAAAWFTVLQDEVDGQHQGAIVPMTGDFLSGVHRARFSPYDQHLYVCGMQGWGSYSPEVGSLQRIRYRGETFQTLTDFHVHQNGIRLTFAQPVDSAIVGDLRQHFAQAWNYRYAGAYGSPEYSPSHPGVVGHDAWRIAGAHVLADGRSVFVELPDLQPVNQLHLRMHVNADEAFSVCNPAGNGHDVIITVHRMDDPFTDFPGYKPVDKTLAVHPLLADLALSQLRVPNPWRTAIEGARSIVIETGKDLTYATSEFRVSANEPLGLTLVNPDVVPHNWVLVQPGTLPAVGELANRLIADPEAFARQYIPQSKNVLCYTDIVEAGTKQTIYFRAPSEPGRYPFLCTFPGHWMVMNGVMVVE